MIDHDRARGCLIGLACGDAVGTTVEFEERGDFTPLTDMVGGGPFNLKAGEWTDDSSMALCLGTSLVECNGHNPEDQMNRYCRWQTEGYLSSKEACFDIGMTVARALDRFRRTGNPYSGSEDPGTAGNGCLMRLGPVPIYYSSDPASALHFCRESARTTHGARECIESCQLFGSMLCKALAGEDKEKILFGSHFPPDFPQLSNSVQAIADGNYRQKSRDEISGSGYVVECLEAALWCFYTTHSFRDAVLLAANLGDDADTTAAVCGQIAGAYYGESQIPKEWIEKLAKYDLISEIADKLSSRTD